MSETNNNERDNQMTNAQNEIKVLKHGIKVNGEYIRAWYSLGNLINYPETTITVYAKEYGGRLPIELSPENDSDSMTDYFCKDRARILPDHPLYSQFLAHVRKVA